MKLFYKNELKIVSLFIFIYAIISIFMFISQNQFITKKEEIITVLIVIITTIFTFMFPQLYASMTVDDNNIQYMMNLSFLKLSDEARRSQNRAALIYLNIVISLIIYILWRVYIYTEDGLFILITVPLFSFILSSYLANRTIKEY